MLTNEQIYLLYSVRWQIELLFKLFKSEAGINKITGKKKYRVLCDIYAKLINVVQALFLCDFMRWNDKKAEVSHIKFYKAFRMSAGEFFKSLKSRYRVIRFLESLFNDIDGFVHKDRYRKKRRSTAQSLIDSVETGAAV